MDESILERGVISDKQQKRLLLKHKKAIVAYFEKANRVSEFRKHVLQSLEAMIPQARKLGFKKVANKLMSIAMKMTQQKTSKKVKSKATHSN